MPETGSGGKRFSIQLTGRREREPGTGPGVRGGAGAARPGDAAGLGAFADLVRTEVTAEVTAEVARGAAAEVELADLAADTVVELELEGGVRWWTSVERLEEHLAAADAATPGSRGGADPLVRGDGTLALPPVLPFGTPTRGVGGLALRVLRTFDVDLPAVAAREVAQRLEERLDPGPGLYRWPRPGELGDAVENPAGVPGGGPLLVFLHGTASTTLGSFGKLTEGDRRGGWRRLESTYGSRILAFEHRSLSQSPGQNARDLVRLLPAGATVHLVSHSRGGLVGELLCRGAYADGRPAFTDDELEAFETEGREDDLAALRELSELLTDKRLRIERFVRVACPARGTILASKRLDRYLSLLLNSLGLALGGAANVPYQFAKSLTLALAKQRAEPGELPGLEAMIPSSPLVATLNDPKGRLDADLSVIAGDLEGSGVLGRLKVFATDLFFRHDHDLVVDSRAMFGGGPRVRGRAHYHFERGTEINHFLYFTHPTTSSLVVRALIDGADGVSAFRPLEVGTPPEGVRGIRADGLVKPDALDALRDDRPVVVLLPGILGSRLQAGDNVVWLDLSDIVKGRFARLALDAGDVEAVDLLERTYQPTVRFLGRTHEVVAHPYDWRLSLDGEAAKVADTVAKVLERTEQTVHLVAHSMGGLVARRLRQNHDAVWRALKQRDGFRFVMLGTPNRGSHSIVSILFGREPTLNRLALADLRHGKQELLRIIASFPGLLALLPETRNALGSGGGGGDGGDGAGAMDLLEPATWKAWQGIDPDVTAPAAGDLAAIARLRRALNEDELDDEAICYVAGQAPTTSFAAVVHTDPDGDERLDLLLTARGDGQVLWDTGIPDAVRRGGRLWYARGVRHGDLAKDRGVLKGVLDLLQRGSTDRLSRDEPPPEATGTRGAVDGAAAPTDELMLFPTEDELEAGFGASPEDGEVAADGAALRLLVTHGSLVYANNPVAVGHYEDDVLAGTEGVIDRYLLDGALDRQHQLGLYPGPVGTADVVLDPENPRRGALVFGLGRVGDLTPGNVATGIRAAALQYALRVAELGEWNDVDPGGRRRVSLTSVLVGAGWGSSVGIDDSLRALVGGVAEAARDLAASEMSDRVRLAELEIVELYENRAVNACEALLRWADRGTVAAGLRLDVVPELQHAEGGQRQVPSAESGWWRRLQITRTEEPPAGREGCEELRPLKFVNLTERARAEVQMLATQRRLVKSFVDKSIGDASWRPDQARTLFELLVPHELKAYAPDELDLLLILDEHAASYPWELLTDGEGDGEPLSVRAGLLRQLATGRYRRAPVNPVGNDALVVGDPPTGNPRYPRLPGARQEAARVRERLDDAGWRVADRIGSQPEDVVTALFARPYRVIHIAAHGEYDPDCRAHSGVLLADGMLLTPAEFGQLRQVPELVFLNCCHLGRIEELPETALRYRNELAANVGLKLIEVGVRAVVAAGWVVDDGAADTFARLFYEEMLAGSEFGDAVQAARRATWLNHPGVNTWGAYQCYGDPSYRLTRGEQRSVDRRWVDPIRPVLELGNIRSRAKTGTAPERLGTEIESIEERLRSRHPRWLRRGDVCEALGRAWAETATLVAWTRLDGPEIEALSPDERRTAAQEVRAAYRRAVTYLEAALSSEEGEVNVSALETLCNLQVRGRYAEYRYLGMGGGDGDGAGDGEEDLQARYRELANGIAGIVRHLEQLNEVASSAERLRLVGSGYKRLAAMAVEGRSQSKTELLLKAVEAYGAGLERALAEDGDVAYSATNLCACRAAFALLDGRRDSRELGGRETLAERRRLLAGLEARRGARNFWDRVAAADATLADLLLAWAAEAPEAEREAARSGRVAALYADAYRGQVSPLQFSSVVEHLDLMIDVLDDRGAVDTGREKAARRRAARRAVRTVRSEVMAYLRRAAGRD